jgi:hypothetical protein
MTTMPHAKSFQHISKVSETRFILAPRGKLCPLHRGEVVPQGWKSSVRPSILLNISECSPHRNLSTRTSKFVPVQQTFSAKKILVKSLLISTLDKVIYYDGTIFLQSTKPLFTSQNRVETSWKKFPVFFNMCILYLDFYGSLLCGRRGEHFTWVQSSPQGSKFVPRGKLRPLGQTHFVKNWPRICFFCYAQNADLSGRMVGWQSDYFLVCKIIVDITFNALVFSPVWK